MKYPRTITLTGADERTNIEDLAHLASLGAEVGLLYTFSPDGRNRYPRWGWIFDVAKSVGGIAVHICGKRSREICIRGDIVHVLKHVGRFQVNGHLTPRELLTICEYHPAQTVITQHNEANAHLASLDIENHSILVDASGGRGKLPGSWVRPETKRPVGFAGGLGPDNLRFELPKIDRVADGSSWIDMENSLRDADDWFSVDRALKAVQIFLEWRDDLHPVQEILPGGV